MTDDATQRMAKFDGSSYNVIVFDEIYIANIVMLAKPKRYSENNTDKTILATGDTNQLETIDVVSNQIDYETYTDHCINTISPNGFTLHKKQTFENTIRKRHPHAAQS